MAEQAAPAPAEESQEDPAASNATSAGAPPEGGDPETFDRAYVEQLRRENARYRTDAKDAPELRKQLQEIEDAKKSDQQKLQERLDAAEAAASTSSTELLRFRAALKHGIPEDLTDLITGADEDEINERAERLATRLGSTSPRIPSVPAGAQPPATKPEDFVRSLFTRGR